MSNTKWTIDPAHTEIGFKVKHLMIANVKGSFSEYTASIETEDDDFSKAKISFEASVDSIDTRNTQRDVHLKSGDFFEIEKYPKLSFKGKSLDKVQGNLYKLTGELTIKGITREISLDAELTGMSKDPWGNSKAGFEIKGKFNRTDFGLIWNAPLETGGMLLGEDVHILIELELTKAQNLAA